MKLLLLVITPLFVANTAFAMKLQRAKKIVTQDEMNEIFKSWKPKLLPKDSARQQVVDVSKELMREYYITEELQRYSKKQTDLLKLLEQSLDDIEKFPADIEFLQAMIDRQDSIEKTFKDYDGTDSSQESKTDFLSPQFLDKTRASNKELEKQLAENRERILTFLNDEQVTKWIDNAGTQKAITDLQAISTTKPESLLEADTRLCILNWMQKTSQNKHAMLQNCLSCIKKYLHGNFYTELQIMHVFQTRIKALSQLHKKVAEEKSHLESFIAAHKNTKSNRANARAKKHTHKTKTDNTQNTQRDALLFPSVPEEEPSYTLKGNYPFHDINPELYFQDTINAAMDKWTHQISFVMDLSNTVDFIDNNARVSILHAVSTGTKHVSIETIKRKRSARKRPYLETDGLEFPDEHAQRYKMRFANKGDMKLFHYPPTDEFYLFNPRIDAKNAYLVEKFLATCEHHTFDVTSPASDEDQNPEANAIRPPQ